MNLLSTVYSQLWNSGGFLFSSDDDCNSTGRERETVNSWTISRTGKVSVSINTFTTWFQPTRLNRAEGTPSISRFQRGLPQVLTRTYGDIVKSRFS